MQRQAHLFSITLNRTCCNHSIIEYAIGGTIPISFSIQGNNAPYPGAFVFVEKDHGETDEPVEFFQAYNGNAIADILTADSLGIGEYKLSIVAIDRFLSHFAVKEQAFSISNSVTKTSELISDESLKNITISPNPAMDQISFRTVKLNENISFSIFDVHGREILAERVIRAADMIDISWLPAGMYYLHIFQSNGSVIRKLVKH